MIDWRLADTAMTERRIAAYFPHHFNARGTGSYTCLSLCENMRGDGLELELHVPASDPDGRRAFTRDALPRYLKPLAYSLDPQATLARRLLRRQFRRALAGADLAYLWAATPEHIYEDVKQAGRPLCVERINCHRLTAVPILDEAYRRAGIAPAHGITDASVAEEQRKLAAADWIFAPSPFVRRSLIAAGIPAGKVLSTSYGWSPQRSGAPRRERAAKASVFLFVGTVCIRKGAHLLAEAWAQAAVPGQLEFCGQLLPEIERVSRTHLARPDVRLRGQVTPISSAYAAADVFVFPTLEEGSPLVVMEAMAQGLPVLTSPMGAGEILRDGIEGLVLDPYDRDGWVGAIRQLATDSALRERLGDAARRRAQDFTWDKVGARRRELLLATCADRRPAGH